MSGVRLGFVMLAAIAGFALFGPLLTAADPIAQDLLHTLAPASSTHWLGTDHLGRDVLARLAHGAARSLGLALGCVAGAALLGLTLGLLAAQGARWRDIAIMRLCDLMLALPGLLLVLVLAGLLGGGTMPVVLGLILTLWPQFARMARSVAIGVLAAPHVEAAALAGFPARTILLRHVLPVVLRHTMPLTTLSIGAAVLSIASLGFLGLGLQPPTPEWGAMINELLPHMAEAPVQMAAPCLAIFVSVLGVTLLGTHYTNRA